MKPSELLKQFVYLYEAYLLLAQRKEHFSILGHSNTTHARRRDGGGRAKPYAMHVRGKGAETSKSVRKKPPFARIL